MGSIIPYRSQPTRVFFIAQMANHPYILIYKDPLQVPTFWYRQAIYFDLKVHYTPN